MPLPIMPDLVYELTGVGDPALSPDGARLAFVRSRVDRETMENHSQVMMMRLPDGEAVPFTSGTKDGKPEFSPDGEMIAFIRPDSRGRQQLWVIAVAGGEARQVTSVPGGVTEFAWSPDSRALAFVSDVDPDRPPDDHDPKKDPRVRVARRIRYRGDALGWRGDAFRHLFVAEVESGQSRQLTDGEGDASSPAWSPDGARIAFIADRHEDRDITNRFSRSQVYVVSADGGELEQWSEGLLGVMSVAWSPDGKRMAVIGSDDEDADAFSQGWIFILEPGMAPRCLTDDSVKPTSGYPPIVPPPELKWARDGRILFIAESRGESYLCEVSAQSGGLRRLAGGGAQFSDAAFDAAGGKVAVVAVSPTSSGDIHLIDVRHGSQRQLTEYNKEYFEQHPPASMEKFCITRAGMEIEARLWLPPDFDPSQKYPLVLDIHGGPHAAFYDAFNAMQQMMATNGYIVLAVNPRGSGTYGAEFVKAVMRDWGGEDYLDIMAALDEVCARPYVDASRLGLQGYSYGGFMSSWIVGHDTRFRSAVVGAPCTNLVSMYGTSDIGVSFGEREWGGMLKDNYDEAVKRSPITYAPNVETPVLLLHGEDDFRCPIGQSEEYFVALKRLGKEAEMVRFPGCSHAFLRVGHPRLREEALARMLAWHNKHLDAKA